MTNETKKEIKGAAIRAGVSFGVTLVLTLAVAALTKGDE